jgi:hypothetical protein
MLIDESFALGSYKVTNVDRDAVSKSSFSIGGYGQSTTSTGYTYELNVPSTYKAACGSESRQKRAAMGGVTSVDWNNTEITCECSGAQGKARLKLTGRETATSGELKIGDTLYHLVPVTETDTTSFASGPAGFRVDTTDREQTAMAAVETLYPGRIWLSKATSPETAEPLSCVLVGLMLYVPPSEK